MASDRLIVRLAYQRGWQVVDGSTILTTSETKEAAFQHLVASGARVRLDWGPTLIAGQSKPCDFSATFQSDNAGRIMKQFHGPSAGRWSWFSRSSSGSVERKEEGVFEVERAYTRRVAGADLLR